jgi:hypothetical protein
MDNARIENKEKVDEKKLAKKINKKPPHVRQTLTSKYRMLQANPLLMHELGKKVNSSKLCDKDFLVKPQLRTLVEVLDSNAVLLSTKIKSEEGASGAVLDQHKIFIHNTKNVTKNKHLTQRPLSDSNNVMKRNLMNSQTSFKDVSFAKLQTLKEKNCDIFELKEKVILKSTKLSVTNDKITLYHNKDSNQTQIRRQDNLLNPNSKELTRRLSTWLKLKGKSFKNYHHLKCFGVHHASKYDKQILTSGSDSNKENIETESKIINENSTTVQSNVLNHVDSHGHGGFDLSAIAQDALLDLHKLILEGYSLEQCEIWLKLIKKRYPLVEQKPQYWECRAALEQSRGNINLAVECYKTAIIQGAEIENVEEHLDQLLQKFSLLNISKETQSYRNNDRMKILEDARNIFKSSVIQFAVQERTLRRKNKEGISIERKLVATPVRRSTRLSRSGFVSTPGIKIFSSLQDVDSCIRSTLNFECNNALKE